MSKTTITKVTARQVYSGRGYPGIEATVITENGAKGVAVCVSGQSTGAHEVPFVFDDTGKFNGRGVMKAVNNVNEIIAPSLIGLNADEQQIVDYTMLNLIPDPKLTLGGNSIASVSAAVLKAGAAALDIPLYRHIGGPGASRLPVPGVSVLSGHERYGGGVTSPGGKPSVTVMCYDFTSFSEASYAAWEISRLWQQMMKSIFGLAPNSHGAITVPANCVNHDNELLEMISKAIINAGYEGKCGLMIDVAADTYYNKNDNIYYGLFDKKPKTETDLFEYYKYIVKTYPVVILEDPFNENDYDSTSLLTKAVDIQITGDDLFTTNPDRVKYGISKGACNTVLLKVNQIGTITESLEMVQYAYKHNYAVMPCNSRGEGEAIADYCVGINAGSVKESAINEAGNRFLAIEAELGSNAKFSGKTGLKGLRFI